MKWPLLTVIVILFGAAGCSKKNDPQTGTSGPGLLNGTWQWTSSQGGFGASHSPAGGTIITISFRADSSYSLMLNNSQLLSGRFHTSYLSPDPVLVIHFDANLTCQELQLPRNQLVNRLQPDSMYTYDADYADGFAHYFIRKN